jgi:hypothetical protein
MFRTTTKRSLANKLDEADRVVYLLALASEWDVSSEYFTNEVENDNPSQGGEVGFMERI